MQKLIISEISKSDLAKFVGKYSCRVPLILLVTLIAFSCATPYKPVTTFAEQDDERHKKTEAFINEKYPEKNYKSLAFGKTIVYKPESFQTLDSLYAVKQEYIDNNEIRELKLSGVEEMIDNYRPIAQREIDEVKYEHEHIYYLEEKDSLKVFHDFFVFDHKDSLLIHTSLYNYKVPKKWRDLHNSYLFEFHFLTDRDLYISTREREFIRLFKSRETELIGEPQLQPFMNHTMELMALAKSISTVDYNELTKYISASEIARKYTDPKFEEFGTLVALESKNGEVLGYERTLKWRNGEGLKQTSFQFNIFLEIEEKETVNIQK